MTTILKEMTIAQLTIRQKKIAKNNCQKIIQNTYVFVKNIRQKVHHRYTLGLVYIPQGRSRKHYSGKRAKGRKKTKHNLVLRSFSPPQADKLKNLYHTLCDYLILELVPL